MAVARGRSTCSLDSAGWLVPDSLIASRSFRASHPSRGTFTIVLGIAAPIPLPDGDWSCESRLDGLYKKLAPQHGIDSWQALMLSQNLARTLLTGFLDDGGSIESLDGKSITDIDSLFRSGI